MSPFQSELVLSHASRLEFYCETVAEVALLSKLYRSTGMKPASGQMCMNEHVLCKQIILSVGLMILTSMQRAEMTETI